MAADKWKQRAHILLCVPVIRLEVVALMLQLFVQ